MLTLRLARAGTKKRPVFHLVATPSRNRRDGRFVENLGYFIPSKNILVLKQDRVTYWLGVGAEVTETARHLIRLSRKAGASMAPPPRPVRKSAESQAVKAGGPPVYVPPTV